MRPIKAVARGPKGRRHDRLSHDVAGVEYDIIVPLCLHHQRVQKKAKKKKRESKRKQKKKKRYF